MIGHVGMICKICNNENRCPYFICSRCINTSPNLILQLKIKLIQEISINNQLSEQVNTILEESLKCSKDTGTSSHANYFVISNDNDNKYIIDILSYQLKKVKLIKELRRNNKIKKSIQMIEERLDSKRKEVSRMKSLFLSNKKTISIDKTILETNPLDTTHLIEWRSKIKEIQSFLNIQQIKKMRQLNKWFGIDSSMNKDNFKLFYQPIVTIQTLKDNINNICADNDNCLLTNNLNICLKYLRLITQIFYISIPYIEELDERLTNLEYGTSLLVYYCYIICRRLQLFPCAKKGYIMYRNIRLLLNDYAINEIFYHISRCETLSHKNLNTSEEIEEIKDKDSDIYSQIEWTLPMIQDYIEEICNDHTEISSRDTVILPRMNPKKKGYTRHLFYHEINNNSNNVRSVKHISESDNNNSSKTSEQWKMNKRSYFQRNSRYTPIGTKTSPSTVKIMPTTNIHTKSITDTDGRGKPPTTDRWFVVG